MRRWTTCIDVESAVEFLLESDTKKRIVYGKMSNCILFFTTIVPPTFKNRRVGDNIIINNNDNNNNNSIKFK